MDDSLYIWFTWSRFNPLSLAALPYAKVSALCFFCFLFCRKKKYRTKTKPKQNKPTKQWVKIWRVFRMQRYCYTQRCLDFWLQPQAQEEGSSPQGSSNAENPLSSHHDTQGASGSNVTKGRLAFFGIDSFDTLENYSRITDISDLWDLLCQFLQVCTLKVKPNNSIFQCHYQYTHEMVNSPLKKL